MDDALGVVEHGGHGSDPEIEFGILAGVGPGLAHFVFPAGEKAGDFVFVEEGLALLAVGGEGAEERAHFTVEGSIDIDVVGPVEESEELVILFLRDGIELMVVALGAAGGEAEPSGGNRVGAIDDLLEAGFGAVDARFTVDEDVAMETSGYFLVGGRVGEEVAGDLFDRELVKRHVGVEGINDPLAVAPGVGPDLVFFIAIGVGVAGEVEPLAGPFFAVVGGVEVSFDESFVGVGPEVGEEVCDLLGRRGDA